MAEDDLPEKFDVIVIGTGLLESILAAAFARVGHSVLHIDRNDYYCGDWASFSLHGLEGWIKEQQTGHPDPVEHPEPKEVTLEEGDILVECPLYGNTNTHIETGFLVCEDEPDPQPPAEQPSDTLGEVPGDSSPSGSNDTQLVPDISQLSVTEASKITETVTEKSCESTEGLDKQSRITVGEKQHADKESCTSEAEEETAELTNSPTTSHTKHEETNTETVTEVDLSRTSHCTNVPDGEGGQLDPAACDYVSEPRTQFVSSWEPGTDATPQVWTKPSIEKEWRKFNIDLSPRLLYCRGAMVELLINSDVSKYCEFKTITRVLTYLNGELQKVPCSRADVFSSKSVSMIEKRMMMKFITFCMEYEKHPEQYQDFLDKPFSTFLDSRKLKPNIKHFILHSIAMATDTTLTLQGLENTQKFILSLGRYGNTAFLWPLYGSGELPQAFARMCAVFGGIYCLRMTASSVIVDKENKYRGIVTTEGHRIESKWLVAETSYLPKQYLPSGYGSRSTCRAILMTDKSIHPADSEQLTLLHLPCPDDPNRPVSVLELGPSSMACPQGMYLVHLCREGADNSCSPREDLQPALDLLFPDSASPSDSGPSILWYMYFRQSNTQGVETQTPDHVVTIPGPGSELDMDHVVKQAKDIFARLCPDEEFLPKAPNPEDIIFDDGKSAEPGEGFQDKPSGADGDSKGISQPETTEVTPGDTGIFQTKVTPEATGICQTEESEGNSQPDSLEKSQVGKTKESE
ncbi:rab proteins geranylgeranyltransferase component A 2-like [Liolophura sinensis]|uniref:rab proteins geranylgeranyltransferase component A 2-like n=1 Tax=Liolophura sinensis TaxID=3198878 RepID=UPI0031596698